MALAYTPGLKRKIATIVQKVRRLPLKGEVTVKKGDKVAYNTVVAKTNVPGDPRTINVCFDLACEPSSTIRFMKVREGDVIQKGQIIASKKGPLSALGIGFGAKDSISPYEGTVEFINPTAGSIIIREPPVPLQLEAYVPGTVIDVIPEEGVIIETTATFLQGIFGIGGETHGELMVIAQSPSEVLTKEQIGKECSGKILVCGSSIQEGALQKAVDMDVKGIVVGGIEGSVLSNFMGYEIGVAITGNEPLGITLLLTEGFRKTDMSPATFDMLKKLEGKLTCINGATQIRAGVIRPEIIIPQEVEGTRDAGSEISMEGLQPGLLVRIIREPFFGLIGKVVALPPELQTIDSESSVRVMVVELEDGRRVTIPRANVELIEE